MDINRFTEKAQQALQAAQAGAIRRGHQQIDIEHLLLALLEQEPGLAVSILRKADVDVEHAPPARGARTGKVPRVSTVSGDEDRAYLSGRLNRLLTPGRGRGQAAQGRLRLRRAPAAGPDRRQRRGRPHPQGVRRHPRPADDRPAGSARQPARHHAEPGSDLRGAGEIRPRPDPARRARASSIRSSAATRRSAASSRCCRAAPRTTRC